MLIPNLNYVPALLQKMGIDPKTGRYVLIGSDLTVPGRTDADIQAAWDSLDFAALDAAALQEAKDAKKSQLNSQRDQLTFSPIDYNGTTWDADPDSSFKLSSVLTAINAGMTLPAGFTWRDHFNNDVAVTEADLAGLAAAIVARASAYHAQCIALKAQVDAATAIAEVEAVVWP